MSAMKSLSARSRHVAVATGLSAMGLFPLQSTAGDLYDSDPAGPPTGDIDERRYGGIRQKLSDWDLMLAGGVMYQPKYEGSDELELVPIPMISLNFGDRVTVDPGGVSVDVLEFKGVKFALQGGYDLGGGRDEEDSAHLKGLGDIDAGGIVGGTLTYELGRVELVASLDKTFGGSDGLQGTVGANVSHFYNGFLLSAGASATFADDNYMQTYFGVTAAQSVSSGLPQYEASAGLKRLDIEASVTYMATENWLIRGQAGVGFLSGDAKDSPIVQDDLQPSGMLFVGYKF